jgi:Fe-Mn family superoxide dismutase
MHTITRRTAFAVLGASAASTALMAAGGSAMAQETGTPPPAFAGKHEPKPLPFDAAKLDGLSERLIRSHWENNYIGSVRALNTIEGRLAAAAKDPEFPPVVYGGLKREELHRTGSVTLHEHYFGNLGGNGRPGGSVADALKEAFGSYEAWEAEFRRTGLALAGGSGWTVLVYDLHAKSLRNSWAWDHMHGAVAGLPLLVLDMYEHSFHMDYGSAAAQYVAAFLRNVDWEEVNRRYARALKMAAA